MKEMEKHRNKMLQQNAKKEKTYISQETRDRIRMKEHKMLMKKQRLMSANKEKRNQR
jgi:hypothetical protein